MKISLLSLLHDLSKLKWSEISNFPKGNKCGFEMLPFGSLRVKKYPPPYEKHDKVQIFRFHHDGRMIGKRDDATGLFSIFWIDLVNKNPLYPHGS